MGVLHRLELGGHLLEVRRTVPDRRPDVRRGHEPLVEVRLLGEHADRQLALARDLPGVGLVGPGGDAHQRRLAGPVRPDETDPVTERDRRADRVEDDEGADLAVDTLEPKDRHQAPSPACAGFACVPETVRAAARRVAAARFVRSARETVEPAARRVDPVGVPREPSAPPISVQRGPSETGGRRPRLHPPQDRGRARLVLRG
jgi:hypothetical protein